eukprot:s1004_g2.t1
MCIQDQGASSFLAGSEYILRYLKWLEIQGYPMDDIVFKSSSSAVTRRYDEMQSEVQFTEDPDDEVFYEVKNYINVEDDASDEVFGKDEVIERDQRAMTKTWVWMQSQLTATNQRTASLTNEARDHAHPRKKLIWEVYSGTGLLGDMAELMGAEVMRFGLHNGRDFTKSSHRRKLLQLAC